ncbi:Cellobiose phosphorylase [Pontiella desulfatans]|uniref:Cellobiose phosphorylase n=1 Tax=Pontiella desulfatans TaxID=2750659 RepID=A0A6C2UCW1_PONDE|nr:N,N'-diacetylchitobiose phosphorylase [Pontiella desulfatans]VGO17214.1 Cellobiose phosphorylase [Pontiella desulfatans]
MQYGYFDDENKEYVITRPDTPKPWSNYIGSAEFGGLVTNNAAGYTFYKSAAQGRLTRFRFNSPPSSFPGRYVYLRDRETFKHWSNSWMPGAPPIEEFDYECRHGTGYTKIKSGFQGLESEVLYFVPPNATHEVWKITVRNPGDADRSVSVFPFVEPQCNWNAEDDGTNLQYTQYIAATAYEDGVIDIGSNINMPTDPEHFENKDQARHTFFALDGADVAGFDTDLECFLGAHGSYAAPQAVVEGACRGSLSAGDLPCAAFQVDLDLAPGEEQTFSVCFGVNEVPRAMDIENAFAGVKQHWHSRLGELKVETPDAGFNSMLNVWAPYNNLMTFYWSRAASMVYAGERDGLGYRDTLQDLVGSVSLIAEESLECLELMLTGQYANGGAMPVVKPFAHSPGSEGPPPHYRSDDALWLFNAVPAYVKETGDFDFYTKVLPYADQGEASVFGHLRRAIEFNLERSGAHGLPCGLHADWNDCIRLGEKGETVFVALQLRYALREYVEIAERLEEGAEAGWAREQLASLDKNIEVHAWDGEWYLRAYRYDGLKFGSRENDEGSIFMNPQSWAVLSGHATGDRATQVMESMHNQLATDYGVMICTPPYVKTDPEVCLGRLFNPGMKENGGVFNHTQGWAVMAAAELGMGDRAWEYMRNVMPASYNDRAEIRQVEPYVVCQSTHSLFSPRYGAGRLSWLSGSAVWNHVAMTSAILGLKSEYDGFRIDPCIPSEWPGFKAERMFRGRKLNIEVRNPNGAQKGVKELMLNGEQLSGTLIPGDLLKDENEIVAVM